MDVLIHISRQISNSTTPAYVPTEFTASPNTVVVNLMFFLSLALVLIDAFLAMLVKSWLQEFERGWRKHTVADLRAQERERRLQGLERWRLAELVTLLPILIQLSLVIFCIGLIVLLFPLHLLSAILSSVALVAGFVSYMFTISVSVLDVYAPFSSPVSRGLVNVMNLLRKSWREGVSLAARTIQRIIPGISSHAIGLDPPRESVPSLAGNNGVAHPLLLSQRDEGVKKGEVITRSRYQIDPQTHVDILERLVTTTADAIENIPIFLDLLDQPVKDPTLRPSNVEKWKQLLHITLGLLGDPSTFTDSVARTIARNVIFCYYGGTADLELSQRLKLLFEGMGSGQTVTRRPLNYLFAAYLGHSNTLNTRDLHDAIASLEPSNTADIELLWMVNTLSYNIAWTRVLDSASAYYEFFAAVLTYVASTEQSRRSQVPLTAAVIHAMHTIKSAVDTEAIDSISGHHIPPGTALTTSDSVSMTFHQGDALDLWSDQCVELASALLQPHTHWSGTDADHVWQFQLPLIAALYIDSTRQTDRASTTFANLLNLPNITGITVTTWAYANAYDRVKLAGYWSMALFQDPSYRLGIQNTPFQDMGDIIMKTIEGPAEITPSILYLLDSVKHLHATASSSIHLDKRSVWHAIGVLELVCTLPTGPINHSIPERELFNPWVLFHLDTLFPQSSIPPPVELEQLKWTDTPEQVHIAKARLALYDSFEEEEHKGTEQLRPDPQVLKMFLGSKDYVVCTGGFKWCLNLVTISQPDAAEEFIPETVGYEWIKHLLQVLSQYDTIESWEFLAEHLASKWTMLPPSWCNCFASTFLFSNVNPPGAPELLSYQHFTQAFPSTKLPLPFFSFLTTMVEHAKAGVTWGQLSSIEHFFGPFSFSPQNQHGYAPLEKILAARKQELDTMGFFAELPMADSGTDE